MIEIIKVQEFPEDNDIPAQLVAFIRVDGLEIPVGGLDITLDKTTLLVHLESRYDKLLAVAQSKQDRPKVKERWDLVDEVNWPRDPLAEIDNLKAQVSVLAKE